MTQTIQFGKLRLGAALLMLASFQAIAGEQGVSAAGGTASGGGVSVYMPPFSYLCSISGAEGVVKDGIRITDKNATQSQGTNDVQIMISVGTSQYTGTEMKTMLSGIFWGEPTTLRASAIADATDANISLVLIRDEKDLIHPLMGVSRKGYVISCVKEN